MAGPTLAVEGLKPLTRDLRAIEKGLPRELGTAMKGAAERTILPRARSFAPVGTRTKPPGQPHLRDTLRVGGGVSKVTLRSRLPYAPPIHWGWPKHNIKANPFISRASEEGMEAFAQELADALDLFFGEHGF